MDTSSNNIINLFLNNIKMKMEQNNRQAIMIYGWMLYTQDGTRLTPTQLIIYALIYHYTDGNSAGYRRDICQLAAWARCTQQHVRRVLRQLIRLKLIRKVEYRRIDNSKEIHLFAIKEETL